MAYQFCDTFDYYNTSMLTASDVWEYVVGSPVISSSYARFSAIGSYPNNGVYLSNTSTCLRKNLKSSQGTLIAFISFGVNSLPGTQVAPIMCFQDSGTPQLFLGVNPNGSLQFYTQSSTFSAVTQGPASSSGLIAPSTVPNHGIEVQVTFSSVSGSVSCWLDGTQVIATTTGLNTIHTSNASANQFSLSVQPGDGFYPGQQFYCDYVRVWDNTGSYQNAALGLDRRKLTKLPTGAGTYTQWTPNGESNNWQCSSNNPPNTSDYTSSNGNNYDSYSMGTAGLVNAPSMVVAKSYVEKDDGNTRAIEIGVISNGVNGLGSPYTVGSGYVYTDYCITVDPNTGSPATAAAADSYQFLKYEST